MKLIWLTLLVFGLLAGAGVGAQSDADARARADAEQISKKFEAYRAEASNLSPAEVHEEIRRLQAILRLKNQGRFSWASMLDEESIKVGGFLGALKDMRKRLNVDAAYYFGLHEVAICARMLEAKVDSSSCSDALDSFTVASADGAIGGREEGTFAIGQMYERGLGVSRSNYVAADWYIKASRQATLNGNRSGALQAIESALRVVPEHPVALRVRADLFK